MKYALIACVPALVLTAGPAWASDNSVGLSTNYTDYSKAFGSRRESAAESTTKLGSTSFTLGVTQGRRKYADESYSAVRVSGTVYQNWTDRLYTRTYGSLSSDKPVFATREIGTDLNLKLLSATVATLGAKAARYSGRRDAWAWSLGATQYFRGGFATYRFTQYDVERLGKTRGHMATVRVKDGAGAGATQLWLGTGNSLHEELFTADRRGKFRTVAIQRVQPIKGPVALTLSVGRTWYDTSAADYRGTRLSLGLTIDHRLFGGQGAKPTRRF
jgi:YaiO family outer membrane protein